MTWTNQPYCTLSDVKLLIDPNLGTEDDALLSSMIVQAQDDIDSEIGFSFQQDGTTGSPATRTYDGTGEYFLWIDDLVFLSTVTEQNIVTYAQGDTWVSQVGSTQDITADIILKPANYTALEVPANKMIRNSGAVFFEGKQNYIVTGVFGQPYLSRQIYPGIPNDLSRACARLVVHYYKMRDSAYADMVQEQGNVRIHYTKQWPPDVVRVVAKYSHTRFLTR